MLRTRNLHARRHDVCRKSPTPRRLGVERLEDRVVPAGNVTVEFIPREFGNTVFLSGDDLGNDVQIRSGDLPNQIVIQGINTTLNGSDESLTFDGITRVFANLGAGDDTLTTSTLTLTSPGALMNIDGGDGNDTILISEVTLGGTFGSELKIEGGNGVDTIETSESAFTGDSVSVTLSAGDGNDEITISRSTFDGGDVFVFIDGGLGDDSIEASRSSFHDSRRLVVEVTGERTNETSA